MSADAVIHWAMHTGLAVSVLVGLVLLIRRPFSRLFGAQAAYLLWVIPLIRLVFPNVSVTIPWPSWSKIIPDLPAELTVPPAYETIIISPVATPVNWQLPLLIIWLSVATIWLVRQIYEQNKTTKLIKQSACTAPESVQVSIAKAANILELKQFPAVYCAAGNIGPLVTGLLRPVVILPRDFENDYSEEQQFLALTHELAHIKRRDLWVAFCALAFRAVNWPNPLVHIASRKFRADQEAACDAYVLKVIGGGARAKQNYAATLIHSAKLTQNPQGKAPLPNPLCLTIHHPLKERLMTMKTSNRNSNLLTRSAAAVLLMGALAATAPITIATAQESAATAKVKIKKVMKVVENIDGVETKKTYEIITEDGVTTVYSIDEHGNKTLADTDIEALHGKHGMADMGGAKRLNVVVMDDEDEAGQKRIKIVMDDHRGPMAGEGHGQIMIKRIGKNAEGTQIDFDNEVFIMGAGQGSEASAMVSAAQDLLTRAEENSGDISPKAQKKIAKARKAVMEAQAALEAEQ